MAVYIQPKHLRNIVMYVHFKMSYLAWNHVTSRNSSLNIYQKNKKCKHWSYFMCICKYGPSKILHSLNSVELLRVVTNK